MGRADHDDGEDSDEDGYRHDRDREDDYEGRIMTRMMIIMVVIVTMMTTRRMLLIMVLSRWQRRGGVRGQRAPRGQSPKSGSQDRGGDSAKTCRSQIGLQSLEYLWLASWHFGLEPQLYMSSTTKTLSKGGYNLIDHHLDVAAFGKIFSGNIHIGLFPRTKRLFSRGQ